jgi:predicted ATPase
MKAPPLRSFRVENFKAIRDSGRVELGPLTVFIGNNGVGKSSLVEALETFRDVVLDGVDTAFHRWHGFEHVWNKAPHRKLIERPDHRSGQSHPLRCRFDWKFAGKQLIGQQSITQGPGGNSLFIQQEQLIQRRTGRTERWTRNDKGEVLFVGRRGTDDPVDAAHLSRLADGESMHKRFAWESFERWQFLRLNPDQMGHPTPQQRAARFVKLAQDGSNVAAYLHALREMDRAAFDDLLEAIRHVLPYAIDLQPTLTSELERAIYLKLWEDHYEVPGWVLSTGTLRIVALLACLRHPNPPPLLVVEEIENGLDPSTLHLLVEEIRSVITAGTTQVILTTHSPYLLDLLDLSHIIVVEREDGQPVFRRPDGKELAAWSKSFSPGRLYTMGRLTRDLP